MQTTRTSTFNNLFAESVGVLFFDLLNLTVILLLYREQNEKVTPCTVICASVCWLDKLSAFTAVIGKQIHAFGVPEKTSPGSLTLIRLNNTLLFII